MLKTEYRQMRNMKTHIALLGENIYTEYYLSAIVEINVKQN